MQLRPITVSVFKQSHTHCTTLGWGRGLHIVCSSADRNHYYYNGMRAVRNYILLYSLNYESLLWLLYDFEFAVQICHASKTARMKNTYSVQLHRHKYRLLQRLHALRRSTLWKIGNDEMMKL